MNHDGETEQSQGETVSDVSDSKRPVSSSQSTDEPVAKRMKVEPADEETAAATSTTATHNTTTDKDPSSTTIKVQSVQEEKSGSSPTEPGATASGEKGGNKSANASIAEAAGTSPSVGPKSGEVKCNVPAKAPPSNAASDEKNIMSAGPTANNSANVVQGQPKLPLKALRMSHLQQKYSGELEYMLREFRKLERQLLGAKGATQIEESAGSRERREKLHSFILHLEDTIQQIELGCKLEAEGKSTVNVAVAGRDGENKPDASKADFSALSNASREKEEEENVQKLEEHILANLLPVKVRLKKQLAAQQGATKNPAGMPAQRGYPQPSDPDKGKGTFAAAAEQRRKQAEEMTAQQNIAPSESKDAAKTEFGEPLGRRGSSLTQKLHGRTLSSKGRPHGHGEGFVKPSSDADKPNEGEASYGGNAPCGTQAPSGSTGAVVPAHKKAHGSSPVKPKVDALGKQSHGERLPKMSVETTVAKGPGRQLLYQNLSEAAPSKADDYKQKLDDPALTEEERQKLRRKIKKKKLIMKAKRRELERQRHAALQPAQSPGPAKGVAGRKKAAGGRNDGKKRGPRTVEYICALCSETYNSVSDYNPWWALSQHACPKCGKSQIPRIDIGAPANAIEYHPALLAHAEDNNGGGGNGSGATPHATNDVDTVEIKPTHVSSPTKYTSSSAHAISAQENHGSDSDLGSELSDITDGNLSDVSLDSNDSDVEILATMTPAEKAEHERFGQEYSGPKLSDSEASRLLILMLHANGCPCRHKNAKQRDVCRSTKFMMLHVRDCPGTTSTFDVCPFPWCRKVKHLLYHLVSCNRPETCVICSPSDLSEEMKGLASLNQHRLKRQRERMLASMRASKAVKTQTKGSQSTSKKPVTQRVSSNGSAPSKPKASKIRSEAQSQPPAEATKSAKLKGSLNGVLKPAAPPAPRTAISAVNNGPPARAEPSVGLQAASGKPEIRHVALCSSTELNTDETAAKSDKTVSTEQLQIDSSSSVAREKLNESEHVQAAMLPGTKSPPSEKENGPIDTEREKPSATPALANRVDSNASERKGTKGAPENIFDSATQVVTTNVAAPGESSGYVVKREDDNSADETIDSRAHSSTDTPALLGETESNSNGATKDSSAKSESRDLQASTLGARKTRSSTSVTQKQGAGGAETKDAAPADVEKHAEGDVRTEDQTSGDADTGPTGPEICRSNSTKSVAQVRVA